MIRVTSIKNINPDEYDAVYLIVRSVKSLERKHDPILERSLQVEALSPSWDLFYTYRTWSDNGDWNKDRFNTLYRTQFLLEMKYSKDAKAWLEQIARDDKLGWNMALGCFCKDENLCHRTIVAELLRGMGCKVVLDADVAITNPQEATI